MPTRREVHRSALMLLRGTSEQLTHAIEMAERARVPRGIVSELNAAKGNLVLAWYRVDLLTGHVDDSGTPRRDLDTD